MKFNLQALTNVKIMISRVFILNFQIVVIRIEIENYHINKVMGKIMLKINFHFIINKKLMLYFCLLLITINFEIIELKIFFKLASLDTMNSFYLILIFLNNILYLFDIYYLIINNKKYYLIFKRSL